MEVRLIVSWGREWLDLTKVSPTLFQQYLERYGVPKEFELNLADKDVKFKEIKK